LAAVAEKSADLAEDFASILESSARRGDEERRLSIALSERQIASIQRRNASKLRDGGRASLDLERLPRLNDPTRTDTGAVRRASRPVP
jgi:hypothetical protein